MKMNKMNNQYMELTRLIRMINWLKWKLTKPKMSGTVDVPAIIGFDSDWKMRPRMLICIDKGCLWQSMGPFNWIGFEFEFNMTTNS